MKKLLIILFAASVLSPFTLTSQNNIGLFVGGGISYANFRYITALSAIEGIESSNGISAYQKIYHAGINFENVLVERMLYLQFGIHAMSKGFNAESSYDTLHYQNYVLAHAIQIPILMKYKYFFDRRGDNYLYTSIGPYVSAAYRGIEYDSFEKDMFLEDEDGYYQMDDPRVKFGKLLIDENAEMSTFEYGLNFEFGVGLFGHMQLGYNFGLAVSDYRLEQYDYDYDGIVDSYLYNRNRFHTLTLAYYFSND